MFALMAFTGHRCPKAAMKYITLGQMKISGIQVLAKKGINAYSDNINYFARYTKLQNEHRELELKYKHLERKYMNMKDGK
jgi:hypothetical protein